MNQQLLFKKVFLSFVFFVSIASFSQQPISLKWELVTPKYETADAFVAGLNVMDYGADPTGVADQTVLFQSLLDALGSRTNNWGRKNDGTPNGGVLYIPEGKYLIKGTLFIPKGVTLRGDWEKPVKGEPIKGTILMAANPNAKGKDCTLLPNGAVGTAYEQLSLIIMQPSTAVRDVNIWYPEQDANNIVAYPPAILFGQQGYWGNDYCLASNITLVNAYDGIIFSRRSGGGAPNCYGIYGSPLRRGIEIDNIAEVGRIDNVDFSPDYWAGSGLPGSPSATGTHKQFIKDNGTAVVMRRNDWSFIGKVKAEGYNIGYRLDWSYNDDTNGNKTSPNGHNFSMDFTNCKYGVYVAAVSGAGMMFYDYKFFNCDYGFYFAPNAGGIVQIQGCSFETNTASLYAPIENNTKIILSQNIIEKGVVDIRGGLTTIIGCDFNNKPDQIRLGAGARAVITGNRFKEPASILDASLFCPVIDHTPIDMTKLPQFPYKNQYDFVQKPTRNILYLATSLGVSVDADDNSSALQTILNQASTDGGGIVFLPPGHYKFRQPITIPTGVELKGSVDVPSLPTGPGSVMEIYAGKDDENGTPFITMEQASGIRGLVMNYPEQVVQLLTEPELNNLDVYHYPYTIRGNRDVYIVNVAFRTSYHGIDLFTNKCDNHFVDYPAGHVFKTGIRVGGNSDGGHVYNAQFNQIAYGSGGETKFGAWPNSPDNLQPDRDKYTYEHAMAYAYCWNHLNFLIIENCTNQVLYNNFDFGSNRGFTLGDGANGISLGQGIDQGMTGLYDFHEGAWVFKRNGLYYLTYADNSGGGNKLRYATSANPLGPWSHKGVYLNSTTSDTSHGSVVEYKGQWWAFYHTADMSGTGLLRSICVDSLFFNEDGTIRQVKQTKDQGTPYNNIMPTVPGSIQAEDYNKGGKGIAYWDNTEGNGPNEYRRNEDVDIARYRPANIYYVTDMAPGEYLNYTFEVIKDDVYSIDFVLGTTAAAQTQKFYLEFDYNKTSNPKRYDVVYSPISSLGTVTVPNVALSQGMHTMRFVPQGNMNFDKFTFTGSISGVSQNSASSVLVSPNPSQNGVFKLINIENKVLVSVSDLQGKEILKKTLSKQDNTLNLSAYAKGIYLLKLQINNEIFTSKLLNQ